MKQLLIEELFDNLAMLRLKLYLRSRRLKRYTIVIIFTTLPLNFRDFLGWRGSYLNTNEVVN